MSVNIKALPTSIDPAVRSAILELKAEVERLQEKVAALEAARQ